MSDQSAKLTLKTKTAPSPKILFLSLMDYSWSPRLVAEFARLGCECGVMSPPGYFCAATRYAAVHFRLLSHHGLWLAVVAARLQLEQVARNWRPDFIIPLDDESAWLLRGLAGRRLVSAELRRLIEASTGAASGYRASCSRQDFLELATQVGVRAPKSQAVDGATALAAAETMGFPIMVKMNRTWQGAGVRIAHDPAQLAASMAAAGLHGGSLLKRGRMAARQAIARLAGSWVTNNKVFEMQQFIAGASAMRSVVAWKGRVLAGASFLRECVNPKPFGPSTVLRYIDHPEMEETASRLVAALGLSGFASFDFVITETGGEAYVIEVNPRGVPAVHVGRFFGHELCRALIERLGWATAASPRPQLAREARVVLFPNEMERDPESDWLRPEAAAFHDVPWDDPSVVEHSRRQLLQRHPIHAEQIARLLRMEIDGDV